MHAQNVLASLALLQGVLAAPQGTLPSSCFITATETMNTFSNGGRQPPSMYIYPSLSITRNGEVLWSNTDDMPNSQTISGLDLPYDVEWTLDYGTPGFDSCRVKFGDLEVEAEGSWESSGNNPRVEKSKCELSFQC